MFIIDFDEEELNHCVNVHLKQYPSNVSSGLCNLRSINDIRLTVTKAAKFFDNKIDVLINNGGIASPRWKDGKSMVDGATFDE